MLVQLVWVQVIFANNVELGPTSDKSGVTFSLVLKLSEQWGNTRRVNNIVPKYSEMAERNLRYLLSKYSIPVGRYYQKYPS